MTSWRVGLAASVAAIALAGAAQAAEPRYSFDLTPAPLADSVRMVGKITGSNVLFDPRVAADRKAPALKGELTVGEALQVLLAGSDLSARQADERSIYITRAAPTTAKASKIAETGSFRVAQAAPAAVSEPVPAAAEDTLEEIVVTATKQADTVNRVALSVTAVTQKSLDQQGVKSIQDMVRTIPALTIQRTGADAAPNLAIRGIYSLAGSPTTGVYLDDTALQKRNALSVSGNGSPIPQLFDLERVEVLRGPQGTLYGGSSEGGTLRFITPTPSLTRYSGMVRGEVSTTEDGDPSYEGGVAVGGPIVEDKVGFRASFLTRRVGGYIDHVDVWTPGKSYKENANSQDVRAGRLALLFQPTERLSVTPAFYYSYDHAADVDTYWLSVGQATVPTVTRAATAQFPAYTYPGRTYGPFTQFGKYKSGNPLSSPRTTELLLPSLSLDYDFGKVKAKSVTSYVHDYTSGLVNEAGFNGEARNLQGGVGFVSELPNFPRQFIYKNNRQGLSEELRFSSADPEARLTWVAGLYASRSKIRAASRITEDLDLLTSVLRGSNTQTQYGAPLLPGLLAQSRDQTLTDREAAVFGEAYYRLTEKLKLTAGLRASHNEFKFDQVLFGAISGFLTPTTTNGGLSSGKQSEKPVTPKFGVTYQIDNNDMVYANAAKGYRPGGVNATISQSQCAAGLAAYGGLPPVTYDSDSVWSYEAGAKLRLFGNRAQLNTSAFYIDWNSPQLFQSFPGCPAQFTTNAGHAVSKGFDLQLQVKPVGGITLSAAAGYNDATYTETVFGPTPVPGATRAVIVNKGDELPVSPWTVNLGAQYDFRLTSAWDGYVRADYQYANRYKRTTGPGTVSYAPDIYYADATHYASARIGVIKGPLEVSAFVNNLFNSDDTLALTGGRGTCRNAACTSYAINEPQFVGSTFRPRTFGLQAAYRY